MNYSCPIIFKPLHENDITLLYNWFQEPVVNQWYARGRAWSFKEIKQKYLPRLQGKDNVPSFIIYKEDTPIGFIQYYSLSDHFPEGIQDLNHPLFQAYPANELVGMDLFLAQEENRGIGLGTEVLNSFLPKLPINTRAVLVDPDANNLKAIRCYIKSGFKSSNYSANNAYLILLKKLPDTLEQS